MNAMCRYFLIAFICLTVAGTAHAESIDKQFDDFLAQRDKFAAEDRKRREEGYVLQRFYDPTGRTAGHLSLGGGPEPAPQFGAPTTYNFEGRDYSDPDGGILNLRLKF